MTTPSTLSHGSTFGPFSRYQLVRHESCRAGIPSVWMVLDAETVDPLFPSMSAIVRQELTVEEAVAGLLAEGDPGFYDQAAEGEVEENDLAVELDDELADAIIDEYERTYGDGNFPAFDGAGDEIESEIGGRN